MRRVILVLFLLSLCQLPLVAQSDRAMLSGTVSDSQNNRVALAQIVIKSAATGLEYDAVSNSAGVYVINSLPLGAGAP